MDLATELSRWQFGITTVYHFLFVPMTISLSLLVAGMQTAWFRTKNEQWLKLTRFFGKLFLINFAMGVVTGIVQEFQFGMNWSAYSRFVGDIFGAPLAMEGLIAFFLESTFLGLWIFGWDRLKPGLHLATIWLAGIGTIISSFFILAANSWMQNPVGFEYSAKNGRAQLTDFVAVLTNKVALITIPHTAFAAFMVGGAFIAGVSVWRLLRHSGVDSEAFVKGARFGAVTLLIAGLGVIITGDIQGKIMTEVQPMKMAAAEALYDTPADGQAGAPFSVLTIGDPSGEKATPVIEVPGLLSFLATGSFNGKVVGINQLEKQYQKEYGSGATTAAGVPTSMTASESYKPYVPVTYWTFRLMMGFGFLAMIVGAWILYVTRKGKIPTLQGFSGKLLLWSAITLPLMPLVANSFGWIFTEMGRQPWIVFGAMSTAQGVSVSSATGPGSIWITVVGFTLLYGALAVVEVGLMLKYIKKGLPDADPPKDDPSDNDSTAPLAFAY